ncbi:hypothetical protein EJ110_NYTH03375 [Nymphaea thermarum]|nr:hypothetical protein EJ110_NYTH03375 [Nymphaea thermarum]
MSSSIDVHYHGFCFNSSTFHLCLPLVFLSLRMRTLGMPLRCHWIILGHLEVRESASIKKLYFSEMEMLLSISCATFADLIVNMMQIYVPSNPRGAELLAPGIVVPQSDLYLRRLWGDPSQFSGNFTILLFHYDGKTSEWDEFEWSKGAIHVSVQKQSKWWYAKRFMHPDIVAAYDYIFLWDEDLGLEHFDAERYIEVIRKHKLEISQPALDRKSRTLWRMPRRREEGEMHKETTERPGWCSDPHLPPCAAHMSLDWCAANFRFVDLTAPVFSRDAWRCVWYMIQACIYPPNDLVHGWGLDFIGLRRCVQPAHERIGVVDSQWIVRQSTLSLVDQIMGRRRTELVIFKSRMTNADKAYFEGMIMIPSNIGFN